MMAKDRFCARTCRNRSRPASSAGGSAPGNGVVPGSGGGTGRSIENSTGDTCCVAEKGRFTESKGLNSNLATLISVGAR